MKDFIKANYWVVVFIPTFIWGVIVFLFFEHYEVKDTILIIGIFGICLLNITGYFTKKTMYGTFGNSFENSNKDERNRRNGVVFYIIILVGIIVLSIYYNS